MIGFIGAGNMATALMAGMIRGGVPADTFIAYDPSSERAEAMRLMGVRRAAVAADVGSQADTIVLAVKPKFMSAAIESILPYVHGCDVLSIAAGWTQSMLSAAMPGARGVARAMPNTPVAVGEGMMVFADSHTMDAQRFEAMTKLFATCAKTLVLPEPLMDAVISISGSGPAYVYMFMEALADAGVKQGLPRNTAYTLAAQTALGAAKMLLETGEHPGALKDTACSPGGTTIEAVYALEKAGFRGAIMDAVDACARRASEIASKGQ